MKTRCKKCGHEQTSLAPPCEKCKGVDLERLE